MKQGRFVVDTHVHSQRHAAGSALKGSSDYGDLGKAIVGVEAYDNSARLLYDMECYGVDMCVIEPAFGMSNELDVELCKKHPDKFVANCQAGTKHTRDKVESGEIEWSIIAVLDELEALLKTGNYVGIGEGIPAGKALEMDEDGYPMYTDERALMKEMMQICDLARSYKVPIRYHCGTNVGYEGHYHSHPWTFNPLWAHDLAYTFPDLPIIMEHGGVEGWWGSDLYDGCLHVAASHKNVYLETGRYWTDLYYKCLEDPNIGAEKLIWGTDWGASLPVQTVNAKHIPTTFTEQVRKQGIVRHQVDIWGWSLRQIDRLDISQDDMNLILGGNAVRLYNLKPPKGLTRMFKFVD